MVSNTRVLELWSFYYFNGYLDSWCKVYVNNSVPLLMCKQSESIKHYAGSLLLVGDYNLENHTTELTLNINFSQHLNWHHPNTTS